MSMKSTAFMYIFLICVHFMWIYNSIIYLSGKVESNPESKPISSQNLTMGHWNLRRMTTYSLIKIFLLKAYLSIHKIEILYIRNIT